MTPTYRTVLWDLDGTIADTLPLIRDSLRHAVVEVLGEAPDEERLIRNIFMPLEAQMAAFDAGRVDELCGAYLRWNHAVSRERLDEHPGMVALVRDLDGAGVTQGIASSKSRQGVELALDILGLTEAFGVIVSSDDVAAHKPDPEPLRAALTGLGVDAVGACYVGDTLTDIAAAKAAGVDAIGVAWGFFDAETLRQAEPHHVATTPDELRAILGMHP